MSHDPIVEETRRIRDELAARFDYDVQKLGQYYIAQQQTEERKPVSRPPRKESDEKVA
jgi:hypothetical protein